VPTKQRTIKGCLKMSVTLVYDRPACRFVESAAQCEVAKVMSLMVDLPCGVSLVVGGVLANDRPPDPSSC
jgi:hypothetical protein